MADMPIGTSNHFTVCMQYSALGAGGGGKQGQKGDAGKMPMFVHSSSEGPGKQSFYRLQKAGFIV